MPWRYLTITHCIKSSRIPTYYLASINPICSGQICHCYTTCFTKWQILYGFDYVLKIQMVEVPNFQKSCIISTNFKHIYLTEFLKVPKKLDWYNRINSIRLVSRSIVKFKSWQLGRCTKRNISLSTKKLQYFV